MYLTYGDRGRVPINCGHRKGLGESTRGQGSVLLFHTRLLPSLNDKQKLFKRGTLGQENSNEKKKE